MPCLTAIIADQNKGIANQLGEALIKRGYDVTYVYSMPDLRNLTEQYDYTVYMMNVHLRLGRRTISPGLEIFEKVRDRVYQNKAIFMGYAYNESTVVLARQTGIPAVLRNDLTRPPNNQDNIDYFLSGLSL